VNPASTEKSKRATILGFLCFLSACTPGIRTGVQEPVAPIEPLPIAGIAIMPVTTEAGSEGLRTVIANTLHQVFEERFPSLIILGPEEAGRKLAQSPAAEDYADLLTDFERTGVVGSDRLSRVTQALGFEYFLQVRGAYEKEDFLDPLLFSFDEFAKETRQVLVIVARIWTDRGPGPVWEAVVRTTSETDDFTGGSREVDDLLRELVEVLAERLPVTPARGG